MSPTAADISRSRLLEGTMRRNVIGQTTLLATVCVPMVAAAIEPTVSLSVEHPAKPILHGTTNLPDGSELMLTIVKIGGGYVGQDKMKVMAGRFTTNEFSVEGHQLPVGQYKLEVSMSMALFQPAGVQAVIGQHGEKMTGRFLDRSMSEHLFDYVEQRQLGG